jgi:hypothetical protein
MRTLFFWFMWHVFGRPSVVLIDYDGEQHVRLVRGTYQYPIAHRMGFNIAIVQLLPWGKVSGPSYVSAWEQFFPRPDYPASEYPNNVIQLRGPNSSGVRK